nr:MAG TPA: hypothetical protein [Caudoviricetes sp.]
MKEYSVKDMSAAIEREIRKNDGIYFSYAWREKLGELLEEESRYAKLVNWLNREIELSESVINVFAPADRTKDYTKGNLATYMEQIQKLAILIHSRELLLDSRTTREMRENIEYTLGKLYGIHYSEEFGDYI